MLLIIIILLVIFLGMFLGLFVQKQDEWKAEVLDLKVQRHEYSPREELLNSTEQHVFHLLEQFLPKEQYHVLVQVHLASLIKVSEKALDYYRTLTDLDKSIDFVVVDKEAFKPRLAIEYNGPEHNRDTRKIRDKFLVRILQDCKIPLLTLTSIDLTDKEKLQNKILISLQRS